MGKLAKWFDFEDHVFFPKCADFQRYCVSTRCELSISQLLYSFVSLWFWIRFDFIKYLSELACGFTVRTELSSLAASDNEKALISFSLLCNISAPFSTCFADLLCRDLPLSLTSLLFCFYTCTVRLDCNFQFHMFGYGLLESWFWRCFWSQNRFCSC